MTKELIEEAREWCKDRRHGYQNYAGGPRSEYPELDLVRRLADALAARQPTEDDREALRKEFEYRIRTAVTYGSGLGFKDRPVQERADWIQREIRNAVERVARAAVPDAATESDAEALENALDDVTRQRDAAIEAIIRVRKALTTEKFNVREAAFYVDNVIEVADVERALQGPSEAEKIVTEIEKHRDTDWDSLVGEVGELVCSKCRAILHEASDYKCPRIAELEAKIEGA